MQAVGQTVALGLPDSCPSYHGRPTTIFGFAAAANPGNAPPGTDQGACDVARGKSLLSELLKDMVAAVPSDTASMLSDDYGTEDLDEEFYDDMEAALGTSFGWQSATSSAVDQSDKSSTCSQPIPIPACTYYKDEMQKAALEKLNQKRKWYQQQLETERLATKNLSSKGRPLQACATTAKHHKHNSRMVS